MLSLKEKLWGVLCLIKAMMHSCRSSRNPWGQSLPRSPRVTPEWLFPWTGHILLGLHATELMDIKWKQHTMPVTKCSAQPLPRLSPYVVQPWAWTYIDSSQGPHTETGRNLGPLALRCTAFSPKAGRLSEVRFYSCLPSSPRACSKCLINKSPVSGSCLLGFLRNHSLRNSKHH